MLPQRFLTRFSQHSRHLPIAGAYTNLQNVAPAGVGVNYTVHEMGHIQLFLIDKSFAEFGEHRRKVTVNVGNSVRKAIDDWESGELEAAMLHACNAIDGTAKKVYPTLGSNARFTKLLRDNFFILGPMGMPGVNLVETRFPIKVQRPKAPGGKPDIADVIYGIHRCSHGHGEELPGGFELIPDARGPARLTRILVEKGAIRLSDRIIFGLIAVAVLSPVNKGQTISDEYYLTFGATEKLVINEWWGRAAEFPAIAASDPTPLVKLDFAEWMDEI